MNGRYGMLASFLAALALTACTDDTTETSAPRADDAEILAPHDAGTSSAPPAHALTTRWGSVLLAHVRAASFNGEGGCYVRDDGRVLCKGGAVNGQLGNGKRGGVNGAPASIDSYSIVQNLERVRDVAALRSLRCALRDDGALCCCGASGTYQALAPEQVESIAGNVLSMAVLQTAYGPVLGLLTDADELVTLLPTQDAEGRARLTPSLLREAVPNSEAWALTRSLAYFRDKDLVLHRQTGGLEGGSSGTSAGTLADVRLFLARDASDVSDQGLALTSSGELLCWGLCPAGDSRGLTRASFAKPVEVSIASKVAALLSPECVRDAAGDMWCWGDLPLSGVRSVYSAPQRIGYLPGVTRIDLSRIGALEVTAMNEAGELREVRWPY
jgi:hypothetical protein